MTPRTRRSSCALIIAVFASLAPLTSPALADNGVPVGGKPNYRERAVFTLTNAARMAPEQYNQVYLTTNPGILTGPAVNPVQYNAALNTAGRNHAVDMATNNYFSHTSQNGTTWDQRIINAGYTGYAWMENIAAGYSTPQAVMSAWIISPGHRAAIMNGSATELGVGHAVILSHYWVQDYGVRTFAVTSPIASGSHIIPASGQIRFMVNVDDPAGTAPPQSVSLFLNGVSQTMPLHMGTADRGTYGLTVPTATACRSYYFRVVAANGQIWRYPASGEYRTFGEGGCTQDYQPGAPPPPPNPVDLNGDGQINVADMLLLIEAWGVCPTGAPGCSGDLDANGIVNVADLLNLIAAWD